jgi:hypothetical protein
MNFFSAANLLPNERGELTTTVVTDQWLMKFLGIIGWYYSDTIFTTIGRFFNTIIDVHFWYHALTGLPTKVVGHIPARILDVPSWDAEIIFLL